MSSSFTMFSRQLMVHALLSPDTFVPLTTFEVALCRQVPPANANATQLIEPTSPDYARQVYPAASTHWAPTGFGELYNTIRVNFPLATEQWGLIAGWALVDPTSGQCVSVGSVAEPYQVKIGTVSFLDPGAMTLGIYDS